MSTRWNYVDVICFLCSSTKKIRIDQYNRKNKSWQCRSCSKKGKQLNLKNPSPRHDPQKAGAYKSYWRAKRRVQTNHKNAYKNILFLFNSFDEFWNEMGERPYGHTLDRIDVKSHYMPGNVRWSSMSEQSRNKNNNVLVEYEGERICLYDAVKLSGIDADTIKKRVSTGCPQEFIFTKGRWHVSTGQFFPTMS